MFGVFCLYIFFISFQTIFPLLEILYTIQKVICDCYSWFIHRPYVLTFVIFYFIVSAASFTSIAPGKALSGHVILSLNNTNVMECFKTCLIASQCKSFNYNEQLKKCEVSGSSGKEHELTEQDGFYYYELTSR